MGKTERKIGKNNTKKLLFLFFVTLGGIIEQKLIPKTANLQINVIILNLLMNTL